MPLVHQFSEPPRPQFREARPSCCQVQMGWLREWARPFRASGALWSRHLYACGKTYPKLKAPAIQSSILRGRHSELESVTSPHGERHIPKALPCPAPQGLMGPYEWSRPTNPIPLRLPSLPCVGASSSSPQRPALLFSWNRRLPLGSSTNHQFRLTVLLRALTRRK